MALLMKSRHGANTSTITNDGVCTTNGFRVYIKAADVYTTYAEEGTARACNGLHYRTRYH